MDTSRWTRAFFGVLAAPVYGWFFYWLTETGRNSLLVYTGGRTDCCERCSNLLFDNAQPVLAICAGVAFFGYAAFAGERLGVRHVLQTLGLCLLSFQIFNLWTAKHLLFRTECSALYSPGPLVIVGIFVVPFVLFYQSMVWSVICAVPLLIISAVRRLVSTKEREVISIT